MRRDRTENLDDMNSSRRDFIKKVGTILSHPANCAGYVLHRRWRLLKKMLK